MANLAKYVVALEASTQRYVQELDKANRKLDKFHKDQERMVGKVKAAFLKLGAGLAAAFSVRAIVQFTNESIRLADEIAKVSRAAGVTAETLQELRFAFGELGGVTSAQVDKGLQRFNQQIGFAAIGNKRASDTLKELGVSFKNSGGQARQTEDVLNDTLRALAGIDSDARRAALAARLFGDEVGAKLSASLAGGIKNLDATRDAVVGLISDERVQEAELLNDAFERISKTIGGTLRNAAIETTADIAALLGIISRGPIGELQTQLEDVERQIAQFEAAAQAGALGGNQILLDRARSLRKQLQQELFVLQNYDSLIGTPFVQTGEAIADDIVTGFGNKIGTIYEQFPDLKLKIPEVDIDWLPEDGLEEIVVATKQISLDDFIKPFPEAEVQRLFQPITKQGNIAAEQLGISFQHAFADWLVDGEFKFKEFLKRLAAEWATSQIFSALGTAFAGSSGIGGFFGKLFGGGKAEGGPLDSGKWYIAGERGPEPIWGGGPGAFAAGYGGGGGPSVSIVNNINASGGGAAELAQALPAILAENRARTTSDLLKILHRPSMA